jgi:hypothetical protein
MSDIVFENDRSGGLLVAGHQRRRADLLLAEASASLLAFRCAPVALPWVAYHDTGWMRDGPPVDAWGVSQQLSGRTFGIGVVVTGQLDADARAIYGATTTRSQRLSGFVPGGARQHVVPIVVARFVYTEFEYPVLRTLCQVLADRPELRSALADPSRVGRLAADLSSTNLKFAPDHAGSGVRPSSVDLGVAMARCGYHHKYNRPLPGDPLPTVDEIVDRVQQRLHQNPPGPGHDVEREDIERLARRAYLDVEPWPFQALFD